MEDDTFLLYKKARLQKMDACIEILTQSRRVLMEDHPWNKNSKKDDIMLDLYSAITELNKELEKYKKHFKNNKTHKSAIKNQIYFAKAYEVSSEAIEAMVEITK